MSEVKDDRPSSDPTPRSQLEVENARLRELLLRCRDLLGGAHCAYSGDKERAAWEVSRRRVVASMSDVERPEH